ncbi:MAG TPA: CBO0543 family protein [Bacillales bacterium]|nr:CBO0543 family protein [Bacillales bacterium]
MINTILNKIGAWLLLLFGLALIPFCFRKPPFKDWSIIFLLAGFLSGMLDLFVTAKKFLIYPTKVYGDIRVSLLFDYLLFPITGVLYNQITYRSGILGALGKALYLSVPMTIIEAWMNRYTKLIKWVRWKWWYTLLTLTFTFWLERATIAVIRKFADSSSMNEETLRENSEYLMKPRGG